MGAVLMAQETFIVSGLAPGTVFAVTLQYDPDAPGLQGSPEVVGPYTANKAGTYKVAFDQEQLMSQGGEPLPTPGTVRAWAHEYTENLMESANFPPLVDLNGNPCSSEHRVG